MNALRGFRFGLMLQLAVGPVCLFVLRTAVSQGFAPALASVAGVALADGLYIALAIAGVASALRSPRLRKTLRLFGAAVLALFAADTALAAFGLGLLPSLSPAPGSGGFAGALLLTLSNPLTILFWSGVFSARIAQDGLTGRAMAVFGAGALAATVVFLSAVAAFGAWSGSWLPAAMLRAFQLLVAAALLVFSVRLLLQKEKPPGKRSTQAL